MPKKIVVKKKKVKKPKAPVIIPRKLPRTKCCEEYKTGSAFTIPLGYSDRLGMNRLSQTPNVTNIYYQQPQPLAKVEPNRNNTFAIQTQTEEPQSIRIPITYKPLPAKKIYKPIEFQPLEEAFPSTIPSNKNIVIQRPVQEPFLGITDIYSEPSTTNEAVSEITNPALVARKSNYQSKEQLTRRYIDLLQGYRGVSYDEANSLAQGKNRKELEQLIKEFSR